MGVRAVLGQFCGYDRARFKVRERLKRVVLGNKAMRLGEALGKKKGGSSGGGNYHIL